MQEIRITIGIPTYNEGDNIYTFFELLVEQIDQLLYEFEFEIIIVDDSTDNTPSILDKVRLTYSNLSIQVIHNNIRMGAAHAWDTILQKAIGKIIVLLDADIKLEKDCIKKLITSITGEVGLCASNTLPQSNSITRYSRAASFIAYWLRSVRLRGLSQYTTMGRALSLEGKVAKEFRIPNDIIAIDLYLQCLVMQAGKLVTYNDEAVVYFIPPSSKNDFYSQIIRAIRGHTQISEFVSKFKFNASARTLIIEFLRTGFEHPRWALDLISCYIFLPIYYNKNSHNVTHLWDIASSTK